MVCCRGEMSRHARKQPEGTQARVSPEAAQRSPGADARRIVSPLRDTLRTYVRWETGEATPRPTIPQVKALCRELGVAIEELPDEFGPKN